MRIVLYTFLLGAFTQGPPALAQSNASMTIALYAGLNITGTVGSNYLVQYSTNLSQPNGWQTLTNLTLTTSPFLLVDTNAPATAHRYYRLGTSTNINQPGAPPGMALVPAGSFVMGDGLDGESDAPTSTVYVNGFYMDTNLVSYGLWLQIYQWATNNGYGFVNAGSGFASNYPVRSIYWYDAVKWCNARSQMASLTPAYYTDVAMTQVYTNGDVDAVYVNWTVSAYRLPTEAEWEKAARGGLSGQRFPWGSLISETNANYYGDPFDPNANTGYEYDSGPAGNNPAFNSGGGFTATYSSPVGYFATNGNTQTNGYGLNDMAGNVFEWCWDWYGAYAGGPQTNPHGASSGTNRVNRGGSWLHFANECRTAYRNGYPANFADSELGFRSVLPVSQ